MGYKLDLPTDVELALKEIAGRAGISLNAVVKRIFKLALTLDGLQQQNGSIYIRREGDTIDDADLLGGVFEQSPIHREDTQ